MSNSKTTESISGLFIIFLILLILKLAEIGVVAKWSWWWVTCPLWAPVALGMSFYLIVFAAEKIYRTFCDKETKESVKKSKFKSQLEEMAKERQKNK